MAFPTPASNGQYYTTNGYTYQYNATLKLWAKVPTGVSFSNGSVTTSNTTSNTSTAVSANGVATGNSTVNTSISANGVTTGNTSLTANGVTTGNTSLTANGVTTGNTSLTANGVTTGNTSLTANGVSTGNTALTGDGLNTGNSTVNTAISANGVTTGNTALTGDGLNTGNSTVNTAISANGVTSGNTALTGDGVKTGNSTVNTSITANGISTGNTTVTGNTIATGNSTVNTSITANGVSTGNTALTGDGLNTGNSTVNTSINANGVTTGNTVITGNTVATGNSTVNTQITSNAVSTANSTTNTTIQPGTITLGTTTINSVSYTGTANNANYLGGVAAASYVTGFQLSNNLANYAALSDPSFIGKIAVNTYITVGNSSQNVVINSSSIAVNGALVANSTYFAGQAVTALTANSANYLGGVSSASYVQNTDSRTLSGNLVFSGANITITSSGGLTVNNTVTVTQINSVMTLNAYALTIGNSSSQGNSRILLQNTAGGVASLTTTTLSLGGVAVVNSTGANNAFNLGGVAAASYVNTSQLSSNLANYAALSGATFSGDVTVNANLIVTGTTVTLNTATLDVKDKNITVAKGSTAAASDGAGLTVDGSNIGWYYNYASNTWQANVGITPSVNATFNLGTSALQWANIYAKAIVANGSLGTAGQILATNGSAIYWTADQTGGGNVSANVVTTTTLSANQISITTGTLTVGNSTVNTDIGNNYVSVGNTISFVNVYSDYIALGNSVSNAVLNSTALSVKSIYANGGIGTSGQVLTSNGTGIYWSTVSTSGGFTNGQSISVNNFVITGAFQANGSNGSAGQILTSNGTATYWSDITGNVTVTGITTNTLSADYIAVNVGTITVGNSTVNTDIGNNYISVGNTLSYVNVYSDRILIGPNANATINSTVLSIKSIQANGALGTNNQVLAANSTGGLYWTSGFTASSLTANSIAITTGTITVGNSTVNTDIGNNYISVGNTLSYVNVYSNRIYFGNSVANATINSTAYTGTAYFANNATYLNGVAASGYTTAFQLSNNLANYATISDPSFTGKISVNTYITVGNSSQNVVINSTAIAVNGSFGTTGQYLTSNGTGLYWSSPGAASVNTAAQYSWTNTHTFSNTVTFSNTQWANTGGTAKVLTYYNESTTSYDTVFV